MKFAIDRIKTGAEQEVNADSFYGQYIPHRLTRFFCPECGEQVYWRSKGGSQPNKFYHKVRTDSSPECDRRVDGRSGLYVYERVGLPVYLSRAGNLFELSIGFPPLREELLHSAAIQQIKVTIGAASYSRSLLVDSTNFISNGTTLVPINFVATNGENYRICIEGGNWYNRKWSDYADGFAYAGAIFSFDEMGGKKIRRGDSVSPLKKYYVVTKHLVSLYPEVEYERIGSISLNREEYAVYSMSINASSNDSHRYELISAYFRNYYGVWLLDTIPEIIPLWPPVIERDVFVPSVNRNAVFCSVLSGNAEPKVYQYNGNIASNVSVDTDAYNNHTIRLPVYNSETIVSVDRKYAGREVVLQNKNIAICGFNYNLRICKKDGSTLDLSQLNSDDFESDLLVKSNAKLDVILCSKNHVYTRISVRREITELVSRSNISLILFTVENAVVSAGSVVNKESFATTDEELILDLKKSLYGTLVPVPSWVQQVLTRWREQNYWKSVSLIERNIVNGRTPCGLLNELTKKLTFLV